MIHLNWLAMGAAVASSIVIGLLWYGPLLGNAWMKEMGLAADFKPAPALLRRSMLLMTLGALLSTLALACAIEVTRFSAAKAGVGTTNAGIGFSAACFTWIGFYVPMLLSSVAWENRSWRWFRINAGYHFAALLAAAMILAFWR